MKFHRIAEIVYLLAAAFFAFQAFQLWATDRNRAYLYLFFVVVSLGMSFFRRYFRKKMERNKRNF